MKHSEVTFQYIRDVAKYPEVQRWILNALFNGCKYGVGIYNYGIEPLPKDINKKIFGHEEDFIDDDMDPEDDPNFDHDCIYSSSGAAVLLIEAVKKEILEKL